ncbi:MAG: carbohydrate-binding module 48 [Leptospiraceae bacterium]|nr:carbohydrate-binding module 48 [Leptospiraceae bacterium]MCP5494630.1 carbohydrate-binding module 48 [Leptospiraceae bacterium]
MALKKYKRFVIISFIIVSLGISGEDMLEWIGGYSSETLGNPENIQKNHKVYYYWQINSLKKAVSPRYIRLVDVNHYKASGSFMNKGILFTYNGLKNTQVSICGNFTAWKCKPMIRNLYGVYYIVIPANYKDRNNEPILSYQYKFNIDGLFDYDPENYNVIDDGKGSFYSEYALEKVDVSKQITYRIVENEENLDLGLKTVEFRIYKPEATTISLVGDFNQWNPEHDYLVKDYNTGIFTLTKKLREGKYLYNYIVDGKKELDTYNPNTGYYEEFVDEFETNDLSSLLNLEEVKEIF